MQGAGSPSVAQKIMLRHWITPRRVLCWGCALLLVTVALARAKKAKGENVHRPDANCQICHTADRAALNRNPAQAKNWLRNDLEATCNGCHGDQGPSHKTGVKAKTKVPDALLLSSDGRITCATCHFMHGEGDARDDFVRIDNRRGRLCLSCHRLSELQ